MLVRTPCSVKPQAEDGGAKTNHDNKCEEAFRLNLCAALSSDRMALADGRKMTPATKFNPIFALHVPPKPPLRPQRPALHQATNREKYEAS